LKANRVELFSLEEAFKDAASARSIFADKAERTPTIGFRNEPVEIRRVVGNEPDAYGSGRIVGREPDDGLDERHGRCAPPAGGFGDVAARAVRANIGVRFANLAATSAGGVFSDHTNAAIRTFEADELAREVDGNSRGLCLCGEAANQGGAFNDEVWTL